MTEAGVVGQDDEYIFNEYAIDDSLGPLERLVNYHASDFSLQRLVLIRELAETARQAGYPETQAQILPLLHAFVNDTEPVVRHGFASQLFPLGEFMVSAGGEVGYQELLNSLLPFTVELLVDKNVEVATAAQKAMVNLAQLIRPEQVESQLMQVLFTLSRDDRAEDYRMVAALLFDELAPKLGAALVEAKVIAEVKQLANDTSFSVRRAVGSNLGNLSQVLGPNKAVDLVLPIFLSLCHDEVWGVRKACAESIVKVSRGVTDDARNAHIVKTFKALAEDTMRWVRVAAYQNLGQLIYTMKAEDVTPMFLKIFTDMAFQSEGGDSDFAEYCAFSFPAVAAVMGPTRWRELDDAFMTLLKDVQWKVRKSLAHSLHEIAKIIGPDLADKSLTPSIELFLRDLDEVKVGVLQNIELFLAALPPSQREQLTPTICSVPAESENWRLRNTVAAKLGLIARLLPPTFVDKHISDLVFRLLDDSVTDVRISCFHSTGILLQHLEAAPTPEFYQRFSSTIFDLGSNAAFHNRQMFLYIFQQVLELGAVNVAEHMMDRVVQLADDKVGNVRFVLARVLANSAMNNPLFCDHPKVHAIFRKLSDDKDRDVAAMVTSRLPRVQNIATAAVYRRE